LIYEGHLASPVHIIIIQVFYQSHHILSCTNNYIHYRQVHGVQIEVFKFFVELHRGTVGGFS